ncbi:MAG: transposase [Nitrososphaeraceae archaeon]|nr:transposase [Nitrososphaeraceae archaeon]MBV9669171.1 transposase [Nitrososphaeraceae archaeon]
MVFCIHSKDWRSTSWKMLPKEYGSESTCHRRFQEWTVSKVFQKLWIRTKRTKTSPYFLID